MRIRTGCRNDDKTYREDTESAFHIADTPGPAWFRTKRNSDAVPLQEKNSRTLDRLDIR
jgi:hypothetical protein